MLVDNRKGWINIQRSKNPIYNYTIKQLSESNDLHVFKLGFRKNQLARPSIAKVYASTVVYQVPSSKYGENGKLWQQKILFKDFVLIAKDKKITIQDAIKYAVEDGDISVRCNCPSFLYWGFAYQATQMDYLYGVPRENRAPTRNNVQLRNVTCKHLAKVLDVIQQDIPELESRFAALYKKTEQPWLDDAELLDEHPEE